MLSNHLIRLITSCEITISGVNETRNNVLTTYRVAGFRFNPSIQVSPTAGNVKYLPEGGKYSNGVTEDLWVLSQYWY